MGPGQPGLCSELWSSEGYLERRYHKQTHHIDFRVQLWDMDRTLPLCTLYGQRGEQKSVLLSQYSRGRGLRAQGDTGQLRTCVSVWLGKCRENGEAWLNMEFMRYTHILRACRLGQEARRF